MNKFIWGIIHHRKLVLAIFGVLVVLSVFLTLQVPINYNMQTYLPENSASVEAIDVLSEEFAMKIPNLRAAVPVESLQEALAVKEELKGTAGVEAVLWLDDSIDIRQPLEFADQATVEGFYKNGVALYQITGDNSNSVEVLQSIYAVDEDIMVDGSLVDEANAQSAVGDEITKLMLVIIPVVLLILLLSTHSWLEPIPFLLAIGVGVILNMGSNIILGSISYITQAVGAVLQMAVSMDYAIFLLNRFNENRKEGYDAETAMAMAMRKSLTAIASSAMTTLLGFLALLFMRFGLGSDLGLVMAKGIVFSFISVMLFMPVFILIIYKAIDKTTHRRFLPDFKFVGVFVQKARFPILILCLLLLVPSFLASRSNDFQYGTGTYPPGSRIALDRDAIEGEFGVQQQLSLLVPKGNVQKELALAEALEADPDVVSVISYVTTVDAAIPANMLSANQIAMLESANYRQFIVTAKVGTEGDQAFEQAERAREYAGNLYGSDYYLTGQNVVMLDMRDTIQADDLVVNGLAILAVALTIMVAFRSLTLPVLLVLTIELAIWINLGIPYFQGNALSYIGYLIISTVQLGATVDYAILYTEHYLDNRRFYHRKNAIIRASREAIPSLMPPALILTTAGMSLQYTSSLNIVSELGMVLGRGAILSFLLVIMLLPCMLYFCDRLIQKTTRNLEFLPRSEEEVYPVDDKPVEAGAIAEEGETFNEN